MTGASVTAQTGVLAVVAKGAQNVKEGMAQDATGIGHAPHFPASITYDILPAGLRGVVADIGPDKAKRQGALGNILAFGTSKNAPVWNHGAALEREAPKFEAALVDLAVRALER
jgi:hypothetical protein